MSIIRITIAGAIIIAIAIVFFSVRGCSNAGDRAAQAHQDAKEAEAYSDAAEDAVGAVVAVQGREAALNEVVEQATKEIENAEGADAEVNPAVRDAARRAACRLPAYSNSAECTMFRSGP